MLLVCEHTSPSGSAFARALSPPLRYDFSEYRLEWDVATSAHPPARATCSCAKPARPTSTYWQACKPAASTSRCRKPASNRRAILRRRAAVVLCGRRSGVP